MRGLAPQTSKIFDRITQLECIKPYVLVGGTALSLQLGTRQSEDLDFMRWKPFQQLNPIYDVTALDIQEYIKQRVMERM